MTTTSKQKALKRKLRRYLDKAEENLGGPFSGGETPLEKVGEALTLATVDELAELICGLQSDDRQIEDALLKVRDDTAADLTRLAKRLEARRYDYFTGQQGFVACCAILRSHDKHGAVADKTIAYPGLIETPGSLTWAAEALAEATTPAKIAAAISFRDALDRTFGRTLAVRALECLSSSQLEKVQRRSPISGLHLCKSASTWEYWFEQIPKDGGYRPVDELLGFAFLPYEALPDLCAVVDAMTTESGRLKYRLLALVMMARMADDGRLWPEELDRLWSDPISTEPDRAYWAVLYKVLMRMPEPRREAALLAALRNSGDGFTRAARFIGAAPTDAVLEAAKRGIAANRALGIPDPNEHIAAGLAGLSSKQLDAVAMATSTDFSERLNQETWESEPSMGEYFVLPELQSMVRRRLSNAQAKPQQLAARSPLLARDREAQTVLLGGDDDGIALLAQRLNAAGDGSSEVAEQIAGRISDAKATWSSFYGVFECVARWAPDTYLRLFGDLAKRYRKELKQSSRTGVVPETVRASLPFVGAIPPDVERKLRMLVEMGDVDVAFPLAVAGDLEMVKVLCTKTYNPGPMVAVGESAIPFLLEQITNEAKWSRRNPGSAWLALEVIGVANEQREACLSRMVHRFAAAETNEDERERNLRHFSEIGPRPEMRAALLSQLDSTFHHWKLKIMLCLLFELGEQRAWDFVEGRAADYPDGLEIASKYDHHRAFTLVEKAVGQRTRKQLSEEELSAFSSVACLQPSQPAWIDKGLASRIMLTYKLKRIRGELGKRKIKQIVNEPLSPYGYLTPVARINALRAVADDPLVRSVLEKAVRGKNASAALVSRIVLEDHQLEAFDAPFSAGWIKRFRAYVAAHPVTLGKKGKGHGQTTKKKPSRTRRRASRPADTLPLPQGPADRFWALEASVLVVVAGRAIVGEVSSQQLQQLAEVADRHAADSLTLSVVCGQDRQLGSKEPCFNTVIGVPLVEVGCDDDELTGPISDKALRQGLSLARKAPKAFWTDVKSVIDHDAELDKTLKVLAVATGPLCQGQVVLGISVDPDDEQTLERYPVLRDEQARDPQEELAHFNNEDSTQHGGSCHALGVEVVQVVWDGCPVEPFAVTTAAHKGNLAKLGKKVPGAGYCFLASFRD